MRFIGCIVCAIVFYFSCGCVWSVEHGAVSTNELIYTVYDDAGANKLLEDADLYFDFALNESDEKMKTEYLNMAQQKYEILASARYDDLYSIVQLGRILELKNQSKNAKSYFFRALGIDYRNPDANYYLADLYYNDKDYRKALRYYRKALEYGKDEDSQALSRMGEIFEKFGDLKRANICYKKVFLLNPTNEDIPDKIREIEEINYNPQGYYNRRNTK